MASAVSFFQLDNNVRIVNRVRQLSIAFFSELGTVVCLSNSFCVFSPGCELVVNTSAIDCWQSLVSEMCLSSVLNCIHSPTKLHGLVLYTSGSQSRLKDRFLYMYILVLQGVVLMQALKFKVSELFERAVITSVDVG